jgi:hypothetical protein
VFCRSSGGFYDLTSALRIQQTEKYSTVKPFSRVEEAWHCLLLGVFISFFHLLIAVMSFAPTLHLFQTKNWSTLFVREKA